MNKSNATQSDSISYPVSLSKFLSISGVASRRKSTELVKNGAVSVNNTTVTEPGYKVKESDTVIHNGKTVTFGKRYYIMLNKPRGYVCTADDPHAKKKAIDLVDIPDARLFTAGRLDKDSEGLIIVTNDGDYAAKLTHPRYQTYKIYTVTTDKKIEDTDLNKFCRGIKDNGEILKAKSVVRVNDTTYTFTLTEGKNREIRRMVASTKRKTVRLKRIATGELPLKNLPMGKWKHLTSEDIQLTLKT